MINKKVLFLFLVILVSCILIVGCSGPPKPLTVDNLDMANAYVVGDTFAGKDADGYYGPWGTAYTLSGGALVFDCSVASGWTTMDFQNKATITASSYNYVVITMKVDSAANAADAENATMTLGGSDGSGKPLSQWKINLTDTYQTFILDLKANGFTKWGPLYFAMNQSTATVAKISIDKIVLANKKSN